MLICDLMQENGDRWFLLITTIRSSGTWTVGEPSQCIGPVGSVRWCGTQIVTFGMDNPRKGSLRITSLAAPSSLCAKTSSPLQDSSASGTARSTG
jgi:hypothetical protein